MKKKLFSFVILSLLLPAVMGAASITAPDTVIDNAGIFSEDELDNIYKSIQLDEDRYGLDYTIETVSDITGEDIDTYALKRADQLGTKDGNGVYILVDTQSRSVKFELSGSVAEKVSGNQLSSIIEEAVVPSFKNEDYTTGTILGMAELGSTFKSVPASEEAITANPLTRNIAIAVTAVIVTLLVGLLVILRLRRKRKQKEDDAAKKVRLDYIQATKNAVRQVLDTPKVNHQFMTASNDASRVSTLESNHIFSANFSHLPNTTTWYSDFMREYMKQLVANQVTAASIKYDADLILKLETYNSTMSLNRFLRKAMTVVTREQRNRDKSKTK